MKDSMKKAVAYVRVSQQGSREDDRFKSPDLQKDAIAAHAKRLGLEIIETISEINASGGDSTRAGWLKAIAMVESGQAQAVLVYNFSRFSRSMIDALTAIDRLTAAGGELHSVQEGSFDLGDFVVLINPIGYRQSGSFDVDEVELPDIVGERLSSVHGDLVRVGVLGTPPRLMLDNPAPEGSSLSCGFWGPGLGHLDAGYTKTGSPQRRRRG